jgi:8-oxo-dGTP diphosphatase
MHKPVKATVGAVVQSYGKILLELRNLEPFKGSWCLPGGHIEFGEPVEDALVREVKEETGLSVTDMHFLDFFMEYFPDLDWHAVALVFVAEVEGTKKAQESEVDELRWVTPEEALEYDLAFRHREILEEYIARRPAGVADG